VALVNERAAMREELSTRGTVVNFNRRR
jgi:hypothetical protein